MAGIAWLLSRVPDNKRLAFVRSVAGYMDARAEELTLQLLRAGSVRNNFYMANTEYSLLDQPPDWDVLRCVCVWPFCGGSATMHNWHASGPTVFEWNCWFLLAAAAVGHAQVGVRPFCRAFKFCGLGKRADRVRQI